MKKIKSLFAILLVAVIAFAVAGCNKDKDGVGVYTYNTYTATSPSNWNELTYQDNNDTQVLSYMTSNFQEFDFKFDASGKIIDGEFEVKYSAATKLEDVSSDYVGDKYGIAANETGRAYKITLRQDLKWDDGTAIDADDFVYTMKEQLNPLFSNYRADSYYVGATIIHNAENYVKQGSTVNAAVSTIMANEGYATIADLLATSYGSGKSFVNWDYSFGDTYADGAWTGAAEDETVDSNLTLAELYTIFSETVTGWGYPQSKADEFFVAEASAPYEFPELAFSEVGFFKGDNEYEVVMVLDKQLELLNEDGTLSYKAAYNMASLPLVKQDLYEQCKIAPTTGTTLWTTNYNSSVETSASWGPYKLSSFQSGKQYILVKNDQWYGYDLDMYEGQYQTTQIVCETIAEWNTAWIKFQAGEIDGIGIDVSIATDYKNSDQAYFTPDDFVASLQLQSDKSALEGRQTEGINKTILTYVDFRKALSLSINRSDFANQTTTSSLAGFGLFNSMHYYDVANGGVYRNTDPAKEVLCDVYAVDTDDYDSLDEAVDQITGYNLEEARALVTKAYNEALAAGDIKATDKVEFTFGTSAISETVTRRHTFIKNAWIELVKTTPLEGRLQFSEDAVKGSTWATDFRAGAYDVCMGGWSGAAWDPGYFLLAYLSPSYMYSTAWPTNTITMEFTMPGVGENGADVTDTMSLLDWYDCLNGAAGAKYNWGQGYLAEDKRVLLIAALEKQVLTAYYTVPLYNTFSASLISYKLDYVTYTYNTFMSYGGLRYATYNYDDYDWAQLIKKNNGQFDYK